MNQTPNDPTSSSSSDTPWEEAMSRDFDARVRDLHEAPLDFDSVKGKAHKIRRNRRAAVAGGVLGVAAVITPIAVIAGGHGTGKADQQPYVGRSDQPTSQTSDPANDDVAVDYLSRGEWHQADGDTVELPKNDQPYRAAVLWDGQLVATRYDGEVYDVADVIADDGTVVDSFSTTSPVAVNDGGTTIAWIGTDGKVMTAWDGDEVDLGTVDLAAAGEGVAWTVAAVTGGPDCHEAVDGCMVFANSNLGDEPTTYSSHGIVDNPIPGAKSYADAGTVGGFRATYIDTYNQDTSVCGGLYDLEKGKPAWQTCDFDPGAISPDGKYVAGAPSYGDGLGDSQVNILKATDGASTGQFAPEGGFVSTDYAWSESNTLVFSTYDGATWHLMSMEPSGSLTELTDAKGPAEDSPFVIVQH
ncbi:hypothetical protein [Nocardioides sp. MH1]|uniref:hypothetical protein n=1 Tax=Nocardioides sp. MH1 TaxID=3242490 RepID=UPI0035217036